MKVDALVPLPSARELFKRSRERFVPTASGCYVLATFDGEVLYVGLTNQLRRRFGQHLDNTEKRGGTDHGRAFFFHWIETDETNQVERTWMNTHIQIEGAWPILNKAYSPTAT